MAMRVIRYLLSHHISGGVFSIETFLVLGPDPVPLRTSPGRRPRPPRPPRESRIRPNNPSALLKNINILLNDTYLSRVQNSLDVLHK